MKEPLILKKLIDSYDYEDALKAPEAITAENEGQKSLAGSQSALSDEPELEELAFYRQLKQCRAKCFWHVQKSHSKQ